MTTPRINRAMTTQMMMNFVLQYQATKVAQLNAVSELHSFCDRGPLASCESAWNKDPVFGVIGIQSGPRG
jgi:hypothetical protein